MQKLNPFMFSKKVHLFCSKYSYGWVQMHCKQADSNLSIKVSSHHSLYFCLYVLVKMFKVCVCVTIIIAFIKISRSAIIADPSRGLKTISTMDDISNTGIFVRHLGMLSTTKSTYKIGVPISLDGYNESLQKIEQAVMDKFIKFNATFNPSIWQDDDSNGVTSS